MTDNATSSVASQLIKLLLYLQFQTQKGPKDAIIQMQGGVLEVPRSMNKNKIRFAVLPNWTFPEEVARIWYLHIFIKSL